MNCYWFSIIVRPRQLFNGIIVIIIIIIIIINFTRSFKPVRCRCRLHNSISISLFAVTLPIFLKRVRRKTRYSKNEMMENGKLCGIFVVLHFSPHHPFCAYRPKRKLHSASCKCQRGNAVRGGGGWLMLIDTLTDMNDDDILYVTHIYWAIYLCLLPVSINIRPHSLARYIHWIIESSAKTISCRGCSSISILESNNANRLQASCPSVCLSVCLSVRLFACHTQIGQILKMSRKFSKQ